MKARPTTRPRQAVAVLLLAAVIAGAAWAQAPGGGMPGGRGAPSGTRGAGGDRDPAQVAAQAGVVETARFQLRELEEDLRLAPAQRALWAAYADRVSKLADDVARGRNSVRFPQGTAAEQLDFVAQTLRNRLTAVEDVTDAGKALYAALTPEQKAIADRRLARIEIPLVVPTQPVGDGGARGARGDAPPAPPPRP